MWTAAIYRTFQSVTGKAYQKLILLIYLHASGRVHGWLNKVMHSAQSWPTGVAGGVPGSANTL